MKTNRKNNKAYIIFAIVIALALAGGIYGYKQYDDLRKENELLSDPQASAQAEVDRLKSDVAKLIDVPEDEDPTVANVVDASKLSEQAFFANAQNGDRVLIYSQAKKAILYRPSTNRVVEVAPIDIGENAPDPSASESANDKPAAGNN